MCVDRKAKEAAVELLKLFEAWLEWVQKAKRHVE